MVLFTFIVSNSFLLGYTLDSDTTSDIFLYDSKGIQESPSFKKTYSSNCPADIQLKHLVVYALIPKEHVTMFGLSISNLVLSVDTFFLSFDDFGV